MRWALDRAASLLVLIAMVAGSATARGGPAGDYLIRGARIFDGERLLNDSDVLIRDGVILQVGEVRDVGGATVIDAAGMTLLPGLIDSHVHIISVEMLRQAAAFGVTTELDMFMHVQLARELRQREDFTRADFRTAGTLATAPRGHGTQFGLPITTITSPDEAAEFVKARLNEGSDYIKLVYDDGRGFGLNFATHSRETLAALISATHDHGKLAVVHVSDQPAARDAIELGADGLVHIFGDAPADEGFVELIKSRSAFVIPTLSVIERLGGGSDQFAADAHLAPLLTDADAANLKSSFALPGAKVSVGHAKASVRSLQEAGVRILAGTDAPNPGTVHGASLHRELELLVECGLTPPEALAAATATPAKAFGLSDRGRIAKGMRADLLLVEGDPTTDITATRAIRRVWIAGRLLDHDAYRHKVQAINLAARQLREPGRMIISDFEGNEIAASFGLGWAISTDELQRGKSTAQMKLIDDGADGSRRSLHVTGRINPPLPWAWAGVMFSPGTAPMTPVDLSGKKRLTSWAKGDGRPARVLLFARSFGYMPASQPFTPTAEWKHFSFAVSDFRDSDGKDIMGILFTGGPAIGPFEFQIDQVSLE